MGDCGHSGGVSIARASAILSVAATPISWASSAGFAQFNQVRDVAGFGHGFIVMVILPKTIHYWHLAKRKLGILFAPL